jgi:hypothetical protein
MLVCIQAMTYKIAWMHKANVCSYDMMMMMMMMMWLCNGDVTMVM